MSVGVLARVDSSGLGNQARLIVDLLQPDAVVAVDMGKTNRGPVHRIDHPNVLRATFQGADQARTSQQVARFLGGCDVVWTAESWYWTALPRRIRPARLCVTANPELWRPTGDRNVHAVGPTSWLADRLKLDVVPHPIPVGVEAFDLLAASNLSRPGPARRILHMAAPAMLDRNGSEALMAALSLYDGPPFTLVVGGSRFSGRSALQRGLDTSIVWPTRIGPVTVEQLPMVEDHAAMYADVDLLVIPRRYAGLCLPAQEAAAAGVPVLMSSLAPQTGWSGVDSSIVCGSGRPVQMRGGRFRVAEPRPQSIAERLRAYTSDQGETRRAWQEAACEWAVEGDWAHVRPLWDAWLNG